MQSRIVVDPNVQARIAKFEEDHSALAGADEILQKIKAAKAELAKTQDQAQRDLILLDLSQAYSEIEILYYSSPDTIKNLQISLSYSQAALNTDLKIRNMNAKALNTLLCDYSNLAWGHRVLARALSKRVPGAEIANLDSAIAALNSAIAMQDKIAAQFPDAEIKIPLKELQDRLFKTYKRLEDIYFERSQKGASIDELELSLKYGQAALDLNILHASQDKSFQRDLDLSLFNFGVACACYADLIKNSLPLKAASYYNRAIKMMNSFLKEHPDDSEAQAFKLRHLAQLDKLANDVFIAELENLVSANALDTQRPGIEDLLSELPVTPAIQKMISLTKEVQRLRQASVTQMAVTPAPSELPAEPRGAAHFYTTRSKRPSSAMFSPSTVASSQGHEKPNQHKHRKMRR